MQSKKMLVASGLVTAASIVAIAGVASADTSTTASSQQTLVDKIAQKFNLNRDEVQEVFDESRAAHEAKHQQKMEERLSKAVTDGKITEAQKTQILDKLEGLQAYRESIQDKTREEQRELMKTKMDELKQWAKDNNLQQYLPNGHGHGMGGGRHMIGDDGAKQDVSSSISNS